MYTGHDCTMLNADADAKTHVKAHPSPLEVITPFRFFFVEFVCHVKKAKKRQLRLYFCMSCGKLRKDSCDCYCRAKLGVVLTDIALRFIFKTQIYKYTNTQIYKYKIYTNTQICIAGPSGGVVSTDMFLRFIFKTHANCLQVYKYKNIQIDKYTNIQIEPGRGLCRQISLCALYSKHT